MWVLCVLRQPNLLPIYRCDIVIFPHSALSSPQSLSFSPSLSHSLTLSLSFLLLLCFGLHLASDETGFWAWFTHTHTHTFLWYASYVSVCVCMLTALKRAKKPDKLCFVICCTSTTWLYAMSRTSSVSLSALYLSVSVSVSVSRSLLLQVLIINDCDIKKPKKQFLLRFFDSLRVAFDSPLDSIATFVTNF